MFCRIFWGRWQRPLFDLLCISLPLVRRRSWCKGHVYLGVFSLERLRHHLGRSALTRVYLDLKARCSQECSVRVVASMLTSDARGGHFCSNLGRSGHVFKIWPAIGPRSAHARPMPGPDSVRSRPVLGPDSVCTRSMCGPLSVHVWPSGNPMGQVASSRRALRSWALCARCLRGR